MATSTAERDLAGAASLVQQAGDSWKDDVAEALAAFAVRDLRGAGAGHHDLARILILDTLAVGLGAYRHPASAIARRYLAYFPHHEEGATVWGTRHRAPLPVASLVNGVPLRAYDYNDLIFGQSSGGHPSDMIAPVVAVAEWRGCSGRELMDAIAVGYEIAALMYDLVPSTRVGWDHANMSAVGATGALSRLLGLSEAQAAEAFGIVAIQHLQSNEIESSAFNRRGDLTMWKRFHGADIMRYALEACLLALNGAEGPVRPFRGKLGMLALFRVEGDPAPAIAERLKPGAPLTALARSDLKRWPVGSRGQSAIQSALDAHRQMPAGTRIERVKVRTQKDVYKHLVEIREDPWNPKSREAADHSLPYIVGAAVLDGAIGVESFDLPQVLDPVRAAFVAERVEISVDEAIGNGTHKHVSEVEIVTAAGESFVGEASPARGNHTNPFSLADASAKLHDIAADILPAARLDALVETVTNLFDVNDARMLTALLAGDNDL